MQTKMKPSSSIKLHAGGGIRFGFMRQNNLSGHTLSVTDVSSYIFDHDSFASYQLRDEDTDVSMILAEAENPQDAYMAISFALKDKWFSSLFPSHAPKEWFRLHAGDAVKVAQDSVVMPQGWLVSEYTHVLTARGSKVSGDFRQRMSELAEYYSDPFEYVLLVSDDGEYALELEKYENGTLKLYATVYRPVSDISETTPYHKPYIVTKNPAPAPEAPKATEQAEKLVQAEDDFATTLTLVSSMIEPQSSVVQPVAIQAEQTVVPAAAPSPVNMLACEALLAARVIDEAQRNKLSLADIIRKVIDLPKEVDDKVYIPFELTDKEQATLAERYGVAADDRASVQGKIVEELKQFAGMK